MLTKEPELAHQLTKDVFFFCFLGLFSGIESSGKISYATLKQIVASELLETQLVRIRTLGFLHGDQR